MPHPTLKLPPVLAAAVLIAPFQSNVAMEVFNTEPEFPEPPPEGEIEDARVHGQIALGFSAATGNTDTTNLNSRILLGYEREPWRHTVNLSGYNTTVDESTVAERYVAMGKSDYSINEHDYLFLTAQYETDRFAGFDRRTSEAIGYGRHVFKTDRHSLDAEVGAGARQVRFEDGTSENEAITRFAVDYRLNISETSDFSQRLVVESGSENTYMEAVSALNTRLVGRVHSSISFTVKRNDSVPEGRVKKDTFTAVQLEYRF